MERYVDGDTMRKIAADLGVALSTVHADITVCRDLWREEMAHSLEAWKDRELDRIDGVEAKAWEGWERSVRDATKTTTATKDGVATVTVETRGQAGDSSFLKVLATCIAERCRILGLYAPKKTDVTSGGTPIKYVQGVDPAQI